MELVAGGGSGVGNAIWDATAAANGHGTAADCSEPWKAEAKKMADALAESLLLATAARHELSIEKQKVRAIEVNLGTAAAEIADARGQVERVQHVAAEICDAAWQSEGLRVQA